MTACSVHPGTPEGMALSDLLREAALLTDAVNAAVDRVAREEGLDRPLWQALLSADQYRGPDGPVPDELVIAGLLERSANELTAKGRQVAARLRTAHANLMDATAAEYSAQSLRSLASELRKLERGLQPRC